MDYRREVDGLRALAVIPVILFHAGFDALSGGFVGVDVFFVISGYLITSIILKELSHGTFSLVNFYERRARRILPALFCVMGACIPAALVLLPPADLKNFAQSMVAVAGFGSNLLFWRESGYFDTGAELKPLLHTWSLAVEEQYYLLFPLLLILVVRFRERWRVGIIGSLAALSLALASLQLRSDPAASFFLLPGRAWELIVGALVALIILPRSPRPEGGWLNQSLALSGLVLILASVTTYSEATPFPGVYALAPVGGTALILAFGTQSTLVGRMLGVPPAVGIGLISYSAYLWHQPLFAFARRALYGEPSEAMSAGLIALTMLLAFLTWRWVERPFRQRQVIGRRIVWWTAALGTISFAAIGLVGHMSGGLVSSRTTPQVRSVLGSALPSPMRDACHTEGVDFIHPANACRYYGSQATWAVLGDSHGVEIVYAMAEELGRQAPSEAVIHLTFSGCAPTYQSNSVVPGCAEWTEEAVEYLAGDAAVEDIVIAYRLYAALDGGHEGVYPGFPEGLSNQEREVVWGAYQRIVESLLKAGKRVHLVLQAPELPVSVDQLVFRRRSDPAKVEGVRREWWNRRAEFGRARVQELLMAHPAGLTVLDPADMFCGDTYCYAVLDNQALYFDDDHPSVAGASMIARTILEEAMSH